ncbi:hypothetical protein C2R87_02305 [Helicobacter pylori]|nr:hypothetical protein C2R87_02305 [Helicobacter pylori]
MPITKIFNFFKKWGFSYFVFETHSLKGIWGYFEITLPLNPQLNPPNPRRPLFISYRLIKIKLFNIFEFFSFDCEKSSIIPTIKWC